MDTVKARLDKSGLRVLCGVIDCGTELALVLLSDSRPPHPRQLWLPPGWAVRKDGVWHRPRTRHRRPPRETNYRFDGAVGWVPYNLPVDAACPGCGFRQVLDPDILRVGANRLTDDTKVGRMFLEASKWTLTPAMPRPLEKEERLRYPTPKEPRAP